MSEQYSNEFATEEEAGFYWGKVSDNPVRGDVSTRSVVKKLLNYWEGAAKECAELGYKDAEHASRCSIGRLNAKL